MELFYQFLKFLCQGLTVVIILEALLSWFPQAQRSRLMVFLHSITDPLLNPIRKIIPPLGMLDLSPLLAVILLQFISGLIP